MSKPLESDEQLMTEVARGNREPLSILVRRHANTLLTFLERMSGDRFRAEELFQEVFLRVWHKRRTYRPRRPFQPWLFAIAANQCRAEHRKRKREPSAGLDGGEVIAAAPSPVEAAVGVETAALVSQAVESLPDQQRAVVALRVWNGLPYAEIAAAVGCAEATVRSHMHHALASMRRFLEPRLS